MKKYTIISTYPAQGSQNIGDALITKATIELIKDTLINDDIEFNILYRVDNWDNVADVVKDSDCIIFACLAIRRNLTSKIYTYLNQILKLDIPICVFSAGTEIDISLENKLQLDKGTINTLKLINDRALFFGTRGILSNYICRSLKLDKVIFTGDIAFYDRRFLNREFATSNEIKKIAISDPHKADVFLDNFKNLVNKIKTEFADSEVNVLLHGKNPIIKNFCITNNVRIKEIYLNKDTGLDVYDNYDLHIGYRVHGHVSMLKRRKPSYLLEQDGRGNDYGYTLIGNSTVDSKPNRKVVISIKNLVRFLMGKKLKNIYKLDSYASDIIIEKVLFDRKNNFSNFKGLDNQIDFFIKELKEQIKLLS